MLHTLRELLFEYAHTPDSERRIAIADEIWNQFGAERTVLVWDMSGFSVLTRRHGVVHYLSMVRRMQEASRPIVHEHRGAVVKFEADNGFAVFPTPADGLRAALAMNEVFDAENASYPPEFDIRISCGLDHGRIILLDGQDFFGEAVNVASKLGEDMAAAGEILVTRSAMDQLADGFPVESVPVRFSISGLEVEAARISRSPV